jgi:hypothetical protein
MDTSFKNLITESTETVEKNQYPYYYEADGYKFHNKNLALWYESSQKSYVSFVDNNTNKIRKNLHNNISFDYDYNLHYLKLLSKQYKSINLFYSGGADSTTILETAINNKIDIDNVFCLTFDSLELDCNTEIVNCAIPFLKKNKVNYKILTCNFDYHKNNYSDEMAFFKTNGCVVVPFRSPLDKHPGIDYQSNACYVKGADKPQLVKYNKNWYACLIDTQIAADNENKNVKWFWLDPDNIKSYIKDSLIYRDYLQTANLVDQNKPLQFYKPTQDYKLNKLLGRSKVENYTMQLLKNLPNQKYHSSKALQRITDIVKSSRQDVLVNYYYAMNNFSKLVPEFGHQDGFVNYHNYGKFAWFIDLDSLEVFTQKELIPEGFKL